MLNLNQIYQTGTSKFKSSAISLELSSFSQTNQIKEFKQNSIPISENLSVPPKIEIEKQFQRKNRLINLNRQKKKIIEHVVKSTPVLKLVKHLVTSPAKQFAQDDERIILGGKYQKEIFNKTLDLPSKTKFGINTRNDYIPNVALRETQARAEHTTVRECEVFGSNNDENFGNKLAGILISKGTLTNTVREKLEFYLNGGLGSHSNDARGVVITKDPLSGENINRVDLLVRSKGVEIGSRFSAIECKCLIYLILKSWYRLFVCF